MASRATLTLLCWPFGRKDQVLGSQVRPVAERLEVERSCWLVEFVAVRVLLVGQVPWVG